MNHGLNKAKLAIGALALAMATLSHASTTLVGGGATLPAIGYVGTGAETSTQVFPAGAGSLFAVYSAQRGNPTVSYCQTGSGAGKNILAKVAGTSVQTACVKNASGVFVGFGANATGVGRSDLTQPNFAGADSPLTQTDFTNYTSNHTSGFLPTEFPAVAGAISIAMNKTTTKGFVLNDTNTNFSDSQLCLIFSGQATDWGDSRLVSAYTLQSGDTISGPIAVQYRSDGSGTTFSFMNHESTVCSGTPAKHFVTNQAFTSAVALYLPTLPSNWTGSSGNPAVTQAIKATAGSIGYAEMANSKALGIDFAKVNGQDPEANFGGTKFVVSSSNLVYNEVINGADANTGVPVLAAISPAPTTQCIALVEPSSYANPSSGYPIMAVSYLLGNAQGNGTDLANTKALLGAPYNATITGSSSLTQFGTGTGLELLNTGTTITTTTISGCLVN
ncbi:alkaline phosphatase L [Dyella lipolytica]|uniref:Substrate-binding domain-containing protein n=1 Tax=Dyella lipolytica TaxID=1867835 RepID=A0ABW8IZN4_9GAMM|nr:substrate-binding domain-containing protein [Dyella lipolytica]GLQ45899.1 alkaline phosphatase L [Dyella lipolytica]